MEHNIPDHIINMMAERAWRMQHYLWHQVRNNWLFYDQGTRQALKKLGWEPPRPARRTGTDGRLETILDNNSGEDFLYMHREMIGAVNDQLAGNTGYPRVQGWRQLPRPHDPLYPVPPPWDTGNVEFNKFLVDVKSDEAFATDFISWETTYTDPGSLRQMSLGELGARIEFTIHNQMHMRWCVEPIGTGIRPDPDPAKPEAIDTIWDRPSYNWLGDTYSSHVNQVFWKLHGWVDDRISDWASANGISGQIPWQGRWVGQMPSHAVSNSFVTVLAARFNTITKHEHVNDDVSKMAEAVSLIAKTGKFCNFYDKVIVPEWP